jgi:hypothetical protein
MLAAVLFDVVLERLLLALLRPRCRLPEIARQDRHG